MLQAYLNNAQLKTDFLAQIAEHEAQDALIKGAARAAWAAWDARAAENSSRASKKADAFFPALSEFVLVTVRALPTTTVNAQ